MLLWSQLDSYVLFSVTIFAAGCSFETVFTDGKLRSENGIPTDFAYSIKQAL